MKNMSKITHSRNEKTPGKSNCDVVADSKIHVHFPWAMGPKKPLHF